MNRNTFLNSKNNKYFILTAIFLLIWYFNYCFPLIWDDYVYSYIFEAKSFQEPLPDTAQREAQCTASPTDIYETTTVTT